MTTKPISEMTDQEIDSALAKMMGWMKPEEETKVIYSWHPHDDLNQVWECENFVKDSGFVMDYCRALVEIVGQSYEKFVHSTARQRCVAMLMAVRET